MAARKIRQEVPYVFEFGKVYRCGGDRYACVRSTLGMAALVSIPPIDWDKSNDCKAWDHSVIEVPQNDAEELWMVEV